MVSRASAGERLAGCLPCPRRDSQARRRTTGGYLERRSFEALAIAYPTGQYAARVTQYHVIVPTERAGPAWTAERPYWSEGVRDSDFWIIRSDASDAEELLRGAVLLEAIEEAEQAAAHLRPGSRLSLDPATNDFRTTTRVVIHPVRPTVSSS